MVIVGQDPYINENQAMGLCFSVPKGTKAPPSLVNIFKCIENDKNISGFTRPNHGDLIVNGGHPENDNEDDIVYKLVTDNDSTIHIESFKAFVYEHFDYYETIEQENNKKRHDFNQFLERFRVNGINEIYTILKK